MAAKNGKGGNGTAQMGRRSLLTGDLMQRLTDRITAGNTLEDSAESLGLHRDTVYEWLKKGRKREAGPTGSDVTYSDFSDAVQKARAECKVRLVVVLRDAAQGQLVKRHNKNNCPLLLGNANACDCPTERLPPNWFAAARMLEAIDPQHWLRTPAQVTRPDGFDPNEVGGKDAVPESPAEKIMAETDRIAARLLAQVEEGGAA